MSIKQKMWDHRRFVALSDQASLLWCYLLTGNNEGVPGLWRGGVGAYSDAMRWEREKTAAALDELLTATFIQYDQEPQILRVPSAPSHRPCSNANVLKGWYRRWLDVADSPLKYDHVASIRVAVEDRSWFADAWALTFGLVRLPVTSRQVPLFLMAHSTGSSDNEDKHLNGSANGIEMGIDTHATTTTTATTTSTTTATATERERPRMLNAIERHMRATELWALQEELRAELAPGVTPRSSTPHDLRPVMEALERYTPDELENALRVCAATASQNPEKLQYFNGFNNWHPQSLLRTVGQIIPAGTGRQSVRGRKKFKNGSAL